MRSPRAGVASELTVVYMALPYLRARGLYTVTMPNAFNFAVDVTDIFRITALGYIFGLPMVRAGRACQHAWRNATAVLTGVLPVFCAAVQLHAAAAPPQPFAQGQDGVSAQAGGACAPPRWTLAHGGLSLRVALTFTIVR